MGQREKKTRLCIWTCQGEKSTHIKLNCALPTGAGVLTPAFVNVTSFGNRVSADGQVQMKSLGWAPAQYNWVLIKKGIQTQRHTHRENAI